MRMLLVAVVGTILLVGGPAKVSGGQMQIPGSPDGLPQQMPGHRNRDNADSRRSQALAKMRNVDRQKRLVEDTERLLEVATDLKAQVDRSAADSLADSLSEDGRKKVEEIEKLAHSVKERMKG
jgi:hypothetical protein